MTEPRLIQLLDDAVEELMEQGEGAPSADPRLHRVLRLAADLRPLPRASFKAELKARLVAAARAQSSPHGKPLTTAEEIEARPRELEAAPRFVAHDVASALRDLPEMTMRFIASLNQCTVGVSRFSTSGNWERHPAGDELLHFLEGDADIVTLTEKGPVRSTVSAGSVFTCPRGLWHQILPRSPVAMLFATAGEGTEHTDDPRFDPSLPRGPAVLALEGHDLRAAANSVPFLAITDDTTEEEANASFCQLTKLDQCSIGVTRFSGQTPWERHPDGDELLHALEGEVEVTVLTDDGPVQTIVGAGSVFVCPRGLWHRQLARPSVTMLYGTPTDTTEISFNQDPRV